MLCVRVVIMNGTDAFVGQRQQESLGQMEAKKIKAVIHEVRSTTNVLCKAQSTLSAEVTGQLKTRAMQIRKRNR
jgi:hypothetical protein